MTNTACVSAIYCDTAVTLTQKITEHHLSHEEKQEEQQQNWQWIKLNPCPVSKSSCYQTVLGAAAAALDLLRRTVLLCPDFDMSLLPTEDDLIGTWRKAINPLRAAAPTWELLKFNLSKHSSALKGTKSALTQQLWNLLLMGQTSSKVQRWFFFFAGSVTKI